MKVQIEWNGHPADEAAELCCSECGDTFLTADAEAMEVFDLISRLQAHNYWCPGAPELSEGLYCGVCGSQLIHRRGRPGTHECERCNRIIPEAEQARHELYWAERRDLLGSNRVYSRFRPACVCGWESLHNCLLERDGLAEWARHDKRGERGDDHAEAE